MRNPKTLELEVVGSQAWRGGRPATDRVGPAAGDVMRSGKPWVYRSRDAPEGPGGDRRERRAEDHHLCACGESTAQERWTMACC